MSVPIGTDAYGYRKQVYINSIFDKPKLPDCMYTTFYDAKVEPPKEDDLPVRTEDHWYDSPAMKMNLLELDAKRKLNVFVYPVCYLCGQFT